MPIPGDFHGGLTFAQGDEAPIDLNFVIDGDKVQGKGESAYCGPFQIEGVLAAGAIRLQIKPESGAPPTALVGAFDEKTNEVAGRWRTVNDAAHGRFHLKPGKRSGAEPRTKSPKEIVDELYAKHQSDCTLDLTAVRFAGEEAMLRALVADDGFYKAMQAGASVPVDSKREAQMAAAQLVHLTPAMLPHAFRALARCIEVTGFKKKLLFSCQNDGSLNAFVAPLGDEMCRVVVTSGLIDALDEQELTYVLGHELGHVMLGHLEIRINDDRELSGLAVLRHFALKRYQELSCDRIGLLCSPDLDRVLRTELMIHSGITSRNRIGEPKEILRAAEELVAHAGGDEFAGESKYATHPYGPMRTLAIAHFFRSQSLANILKRPTLPETLDEAAMDAKVQQVMDLMNPIELGSSEDVGPDVTRFIALGALQIAAASDGISDDEIAAIQRLEGVKDVLEPLQKLSFEEQQIETAEVAEKLVLAVPPAKRLRLLEDLSMIAAVDGSVSPEEEQVFYGLANLLQVYPSAGPAALAEMRKGPC